MKDRPNTTIPSRSVESYTPDLSVLYTFISSLYSEPSSERFQLLSEESFRQAVIAASERLDSVPGERGNSLRDLGQAIYDYLSRHEKPVRDEYVATFGHTLSKPTAPYELEHLKNEDVFYRTQRLADLEGFYRAFGLTMNRRERADHISVQAEFLANLAAKEEYARENDLGEEKIEVCRKARRDFLNDHFGAWVPVFIQNVATLSQGQFYPLVSRFTSRFLRSAGFEHDSNGPALPLKGINIMKPTDQLRHEHDAILTMLDILERVCQKLESEEEVDPSHLEGIIDFFRVFADKCHHGKEEAHLFPAMEEAGVPRQGGPLGVMLHEHDTGRGYVTSMDEGVKRFKSGDEEGSTQFILGARPYIALLKEHIDKENNILFPLALNTLSPERQDELLTQFDRVEREVVGQGKHEEYHRLLEDLQRIYVT
ncbi:MAG: hemerythrin domain-containing protein [Fidelibacterota bacterium]